MATMLSDLGRIHYAKATFTDIIELNTWFLLDKSFK